MDRIVIIKMTNDTDHELNADERYVAYAYGIKMNLEERDEWTITESEDIDDVAVDKIADKLGDGYVFEKVKGPMMDERPHVWVSMETRTKNKLPIDKKDFYDKHGYNFPSDIASGYVPIGPKKERPLDLYVFRKKEK